MAGPGGAGPAPGPRARCPETTSAMKAAYRRAMDALYLVCVVIAGAGIAVQSVIIAWGVFTRYVLGWGSFWPEPIAIFLAIQVAFYGGAACYRANAHIALEMLARRLPRAVERAAGVLVLLLMAAVSLFMVWYGWSLVQKTFFQVYPEFQYIRVGAVYTAIPAGGLITLLFVIEKALGIAPPAAPVEPEEAA
jgi:TRAP-type C4-dicarboxylate transport system permease small subunit